MPNIQSQTVRQSHQAHGFTLIEVLVITSLTVIILLSTVVLFMTFLLNQARLTQKQKIKAAGDNALKQIEQAVRGAKKVDPCEPPDPLNPSLTFYDFTGAQGVIELSADDSIASIATPVTGVPVTYILTPEGLAASGVSFGCYTGQDAQIIRVRFTLSGSGEGLVSDTIRQDFSTSIHLRN
jgi:type II secretory pathway pseudopilin PulG